MLVLDVLLGTLSLLLDLYMEHQNLYMEHLDLYLHLYLDLYLYELPLPYTSMNSACTITAKITAGCNLHPCIDTTENFVYKDCPLQAGLLKTKPPIGQNNIVWGVHVRAGGPLLLLLPRE